MENSFVLKMILCLIFCFSSTIPAAKEYDYSDDLRDISLQNCLDNNYEKLGGYKRRDLHDASFWVYPYGKENIVSMATMMVLDEYIKSQTGDFFREYVSVKSEDDSAPQNAIFARCMSFYKSEQLRVFVKKLLNPKNHH